MYISSVCFRNKSFFSLTSSHSCMTKSSTSSCGTEHASSPKIYLENIIKNLNANKIMLVNKYRFYVFTISKL